MKIGQSVYSEATGIMGIVEYRTADGWVGIRQPQEGGRIDEVQEELVTHLICPSYTR